MDRLPPLKIRSVKTGHVALIPDDLQVPLEELDGFRNVEGIYISGFSNVYLQYAGVDGGRAIELPSDPAFLLHLAKAIEAHAQWCAEKRFHPIEAVPWKRRSVRERQRGR